jgi:photosystem II stability/assembly factor-like uncharacterized protein
MKHIGNILFLLIILASCSKEKRKPKWEVLSIYENTNSLTQYSTTDIKITSSGKIITVISESMHESYSVIYTSIDNGGSWTKLYSDGGAFGYVFPKVSYTNTDSIFFLGTGTIGNKLFIFSKSDETPLVKDIPFQIPFYSKAICFTSGSTGYIGSNNGIHKTLNTGDSWSTDSLQTGLNIIDIAFLNENTGFAISDKCCLKTVNGGVSWDTVHTALNDQFESIQFANSSIGVIGGENILLTEDGGITWKTIYDNKVIDISINENLEIYAITDNGEVFRSYDLGVNWSRKCNKREGFSSVIATKDMVFAGLSNSYEQSKKTKTAVIEIGKLKK